MKKLTIQDNWPETWKYSYSFDLLEIYDDKSCRGYSYAYANRQKHTIELVKKAANPGAKVLDIGAAQGNFSLLLAELGYEVTWNDIRKELIDYVKLKYEFGDIKFAPGNVFELGLQDYFDVVLITEIIEHVAHPDDFLKNISQLVKAGGHIVMSTPNGHYFQNKLPKFSDCTDFAEIEKIQFGPNAEDHIFLLHLDEIYALAKQCNLSIQDIRLITNPLTNGHIKLGLLLRFFPEKLIKLIEKFTNYLPLSIKKKLNTSTVVLFKKHF